MRPSTRFAIALVLAVTTTLGAVWVIHTNLNPVVSYVTGVALPKSGVIFDVVLTSHIAFMEGTPPQVSAIQLTRLDLHNVTFANFWVEVDPLGSPGSGWWLAHFQSNVSVPVNQNYTFLTPTALSNVAIPRAGQYFVQIQLVTILYKGVSTQPETAPSNVSSSQALIIESSEIGTQTFATEVGLIVAVSAIAWIEIPQGIDAWVNLWPKRKE